MSTHWTAGQWLIRDALVLRGQHGLCLRGHRVVCSRCGPAYDWPCSRWRRAHQVVCQTRGAARVVSPQG